MKQVHYISGCVLTLFIGVHLLNHLYSLYGPEEHIQLMNNLRLVYRNGMIETVLLMAVVVQIITGLKLGFGKRKQITSAFERLQLWSGFYLATFLLIHVGAVIAGRFLMELDTNFYFGVAGLNTFPISLFFIPYYGLAVLSFFGHIAAIHAQKMKSNVFGMNPKKQSLGILILGACFTIVLFYGLTNGFQGVLIPEEYNVIIGG